MRFDGEERGWRERGAGINVRNINREIKNIISYLSIPFMIFDLFKFISEYFFYRVKNKSIPLTSFIGGRGPGRISFYGLSFYDLER